MLGATRRVVAHYAVVPQNAPASGPGCSRRRASILSYLTSLPHFLS